MAYVDNDNEHVNENIWHTKFLSQDSTIATKLTYFSSYQCSNMCVCILIMIIILKYYSKMKKSLKNKNPPFEF